MLDGLVPVSFPLLCSTSRKLQQIYFDPDGDFTWGRCSKGGRVEPPITFDSIAG
jgi:hypothetical protein